MIDAREQTITIENVPERAHDGGVRRRERGPEDAALPPADAVARQPPPPSPATCGNRSWAIGQLATRKGDTLAGAALAHAVASADYDLTRAEAASALGRFPADQALPALQRAMADTSARVRMAAVEALGRIGDPRGVDAVRRAWAEDASDQVRAAALTSLVTLVPDASREAIASGPADEVIPRGDSERRDRRGASAAGLGSGGDARGRGRRPAAAGHRARRPRDPRRRGREGRPGAAAS